MASHCFRHAAALVAFAAALAPAAAPARYHDDDRAPVMAAPSYARAQSHFRLRDYPAALRELRALVAVAPGDADAWALLGLASRRLNDDALAEASFAEALRLDPGHLRALQDQGELYSAQRHYAAAKANLARLAALCGRCAEHAALERALDRAGQSSGARMLTAPDGPAHGLRRFRLPAPSADGPKRLRAPGSGS